jgi:hypothetical protein
MGMLCIGWAEHPADRLPLRHQISEALNQLHTPFATLLEHSLHM